MSSHGQCLLNKFVELQIAHKLIENKSCVFRTLRFSAYTSSVSLGLNSIYNVQMLESRKFKAQVIE